jgi:glycolate oxidase
LFKDEIYENLVEVVGCERVSRENFELHAYSRDLSPSSPELSSFVVRPGKTEEIAEIVRTANRQKIPIYVRGCGCSHWSAWLPRKGGILFDMTSMDRIIEIDEKNLIAIVEAGCTWFRLLEELRKKGLTYLSSEIGGPAMTVGGSVMKAGGGPYGTCKFGSHGQMDILGFEIVLPTGMIVKTGSWFMPGVIPFRRQAVGPDLTGVLIGSEGIFGVASKIVLRIRPLPNHEEFLYFNFEDWSDIANVGDAVTRFVGDELAYGFRANASAVEPGKIAVRIFVFGYEKQIIEFRKKKIRSICMKNNGTEGDSSNSSGFFAKVVTGLDGIFAQGVWHFSGCGTIPIGEIIKYTEAWREIIGKHKYEKNTFGAWLFPRGWTISVLFSYSEPEERAKLMNVSEDIDTKFLEIGLVPSGVGSSKHLQLYLREKCESYYELIRKLKRCLDPNNILQPGILVDQDF